MRYKLIKDWESKRHGKIITKGTYVIITRKSELEELIEGEHINAPKKEKKKTKKIKEDGGTNTTTDN
jgi:hypothetical protein|tara:strand:- start:689 stop:889 length:201 start_codon:yes stop_codon:yes gene_type:complete